MLKTWLEGQRQNVDITEDHMKDTLIKALKDADRSQCLRDLGLVYPTCSQPLFTSQNSKAVPSNYRSGNDPQDGSTTGQSADFQPMNANQWYTENNV